MNEKILIKNNMIVEKDLNKEIDSLKKDIKSLEDIILALLENLEEDPIMLKETNIIIKKFLEKSKNSKEIKKIVGKNKDEEKYDWIEDTIEFETRK